MKIGDYLLHVSRLKVTTLEALLYFLLELEEIVDAPGGEHREHLPGRNRVVAEAGAELVDGYVNKKLRVHRHGRVRLCALGQDDELVSREVKEPFQRFRLGYGVVLLVVIVGDVNVIVIIIAGDINVIVSAVGVGAKDVNIRVLLLLLLLLFLEVKETSRSMVKETSRSLSDAGHGRRVSAAEYRRNLHRLLTLLSNKFTYN